MDRRPTGVADLLDDRSSARSFNGDRHLLVDEFGPQTIQSAPVDEIACRDFPGPAHGSKVAAWSKHHCHRSPGSAEVMTGWPVWM